MVSNWFPEKELGRANAFVMMFAPLGGMLTAPVSVRSLPRSTGAGCLSSKVCCRWWYWPCGGL
jgi:sugar phosphate permease